MYLRFVIITCFIFIAYLLPAQEGLTIQGVSPDLHLLHTITPKENWYSLGRMYNISPKEIAPYNGVPLNTPLSIGQQVKIPLTTANFSQNAIKGDDEIFIPLYHTLEDKEWMFRISTNYNKVPVESLEKWNNITKEQAKAGMNLIVGYLKVKKGQSMLALNAPPVAPPSGPVASSSKEPVAKTEENRIEPASKPARNEAKTAAATAEKTVENKPATVENKPATAEKPVVTPTAGNNSYNNAEGGYFRSIYEESGKSVSGSSGVFKSTSGWQDGKFYALMNNAAIGVIVKVINPSTNKEVYAKVLGQLPEMKESAGLTIRISDAAAATLGANSDKFMVDIKY